ncbi:MAG: metallophosphoesterase family protein, partial [candidate division Zixibacteria bacterium]|nr:metallophosphoesterase family protein [candidate division Zixibacteria bacterium]
MEDPAQYVGMLLKLLRDDGAIVYLNGVEIERSNMPSGNITYLTLASSTVGGSEEDMFFESYEDIGNLRQGTNILAVEIHQRSVTSSDISFDLELDGTTEHQDITRKAPYLIYTGNNTEMKIIWQLISSSTGILAWGLDTTYTMGRVQTSEYGDDHQHTYTITQLNPATKYFFQVTADEEIHRGSFYTAPPNDATEVKFFAYGDTRSNPGTHDYVAEEIVATYLDDPNYQSFILSVGDLVSNGNSESDWDHQFFDPAYSNIQSMLGNLPYQSCMGNHEGSGVLFVKYFPYPYVDRRYWSYDYGPAHFVVIDQYTNYLPGSAQYQWIEDDLASTSKPWKFIYLHEPGWSAGGHENNHTVQNYIQPLCEEFGVSIVFAGHNHYYARAVVNDIHHVTTGGGGAPLYQPNPNYPNIVEAAMANHFCKIEIENSRLYFEVSTPVGAIIDTFSIERVSVNDGNTQIPDV